MEQENRTVRNGILALLAVLLCAGCVFGLRKLAAGTAEASAAEAELTPQEESEPATEETPAVMTGNEEHTDAEKPAEKNGDIVILYTSDIHCGLEEGFGAVGVVQIRKTLEEEGNTVLLIDDGDAIQGGVAGTLTQGDAIVKVMRAMKYDVAIPGNHEFDYGMEPLMEIMKTSPFPYISCNFLDADGNTVLQPSCMIEAAGKKIGFVGVTTPDTPKSVMPTIFQNEKGETIYSFMADGTGERIAQAIQEQVDQLRGDGADYVILMGHIGNASDGSDYSCMNLISKTDGIDAMTDGHTHDTVQMVLENKDGVQIPRTASGTKLHGIGYIRISAEDGSLTTGLYSWNNSVSMPELLGVSNEITPVLKEVYDSVEQIKSRKAAETDFDLLIVDPVQTKDDGSAIRRVRSGETNLADLVADAYRVQTGADVVLINGGGVRDSLSKGDISFGDVMSVLPFNNTLSLAEVTGAQIADALEWGARAYPEESPGFMQVSGLTYEIDASIPSGCVSDPVSGMFLSVDGERRIKNVMVGDEPLDLNKTYRMTTVSFLFEQGDGFAMFSKDNITVRDIMVDNQAFTGYITENLNGVVGEAYSDPYGQGRIRILNAD